VIYLQCNDCATDGATECTTTVLLSVSSCATDCVTNCVTDDVFMLGPSERVLYHRETHEKAGRCIGRDSKVPGPRGLRQREQVSST
jgi:hypothetical protein